MQTIGFHGLTDFPASPMERPHGSSVALRNKALPGVGDLKMNKFKLIAIIGALVAVTACDDEAYREPTEAELPPPPAMEPAVSAEDEAEDAAAATPDTPPTDYSQLPPPPESSEETVQPESETLFY